jgi:hypothetical protein
MIGNRESAIASGRLENVPLQEAPGKPRLQVQLEMRRESLGCPSLELLTIYSCAAEGNKSSTPRKFRNSCEADATAF